MSHDSVFMSHDVNNNYHTINEFSDTKM